MIANMWDQVGVLAVLVLLLLPRHLSILLAERRWVAVWKRTSKIRRGRGGSCKSPPITTAAASTATTENDLNEILAPIINTKIYWFLKQVLQENPSSRRYICV